LDLRSVLELGILGYGFGFKGLRFRVWGVGGIWFKVQDAGFRD